MMRREARALTGQLIDLIDDGQLELLYKMKKISFELTKWSVFVFDGCDEVWLPLFCRLRLRRVLRKHRIKQLMKRLAGNDEINVSMKSRRNTDKPWITNTEIRDDH